MRKLSHQLGLFLNFIDLDFEVVILIVTMWETPLKWQELNMLNLEFDMTLNGDQKLPNRFTLYFIFKKVETNRVCLI